MAASNVTSHPVAAKKEVVPSGSIDLPEDFQWLCRDGVQSEGLYRRNHWLYRSDKHRRLGYRAPPEIYCTGEHSGGY